MVWSIFGRIKCKKLDQYDLLPSFHEILDENFDSFVKDISTEYPDLLVYSDKMGKSSMKFHFEKQLRKFLDNSSHVVFLSYITFIFSNQSNGHS